jgi:hypothetical protein
MQYIRSRTFWLNLVSFGLALLALPDFISLVPQFWLPYVGLINAVGNLYLRFEPKG